jgi:hypothetical protein
MMAWIVHGRAVLGSVLRFPGSGGWPWRWPRPRLRRGWGLPRGPSSGQLLATAKIRAFAMGTMSDKEPVCEIHKDDNDDVFILIDGMKIAKRGLPDTAHAMTWIMLEPGWIVRDVDHGNAIEVRFEGARIH